MTKNWRRRTGPVAVLTGAGISTDSGIPDFRGPEGVWTRNPIAELTANYRDYLGDPALRERAWLARRDNPAWRAEPNEGHRALVDLERARSVRILTQNIDRLHQKAGSTPRKVLELHGNMFEVECVRCGARTTMRAALDRVAAGEPDPACRNPVRPDGTAADDVAASAPARECGGVLKSATVMFGQALDEQVLGLSALAARASVVFLAVGTSLRVHPAAGLCAIAVEAGADLVIVNNEPTAYDEIATEVVREPISTALPAIVAALAG